MQHENGWVLGTQLTQADQRHVLAAFVHRYTGTHRPQWASGAPYREHFLDDADWLANTRFVVRSDGRLDRRSRHCLSSPTWPRGKGFDMEKAVQS